MCWLLQELVEELMGWITALHLRASCSTVILVGTQRDKIAGGWCTKLLRRMGVVPALSSVMADVEEALKIKHQAWKARRELLTDERLMVEGGIVLANSSPGSLNRGVSELLTRLESLRGTTLFIPPSWSLALVVLNALKYGVEPLDALTCWQNDEQLQFSDVKRAWVERRTIHEAWQDVQDELPLDQKPDDPLFAMRCASEWR